MACEKCSNPSYHHELVSILKLGRKVHYTVPSFPVFSANLMEIKFQLVDDGDTTIFDGYIQDCPGLTRSYPALLKLCKGYTNAFLIEPEEFDKSVDLDEDKNLCDGKVFVIWKWEWEEPEQNEREENSSITNVAEDCDINECEDNECASTSITHSVVFKCMGSTKCVRSQEVLAEAAHKLRRSENARVRLRREPTNPKDARAVAFDCLLGNCWERIG